MSSRSSDGPEEGIFEEFRGNLKYSCSPRFPVSQNSKIWQPILPYLMPQIWWYIQIFHLSISFFGHFSKGSAGVSIQHVSSPFYVIRRREIDGTTSCNSLTSYSLDGPRMSGICIVFMYFFLLWDALCCIDPCLMLMWDLVFLLVSWFLLDMMQIHIWDVLVVMTRHVLFDIPLLLCWWDTHVSPCMFALRSLVMKPTQEKIEKIDQRLRIQPLRGGNLPYIT